MKKTIQIFFYITLFVTSSILSAIKDKPFTQEYHKPYPLLTQGQNDVKAIAVDLSGTVWAGTKAGLFKLDRSTATWDSMLDTTNQGPINDLFVDSKGVLWVAAWNGVFAFENLKPNKVKEIVGPIGAISEIEGSIIAMGSEGLWKKKGKSWNKENISFSKAIRKLIPDKGNGYYLATGKGLYHKNRNQITLFQNEEEILSDNIYGFDYAEDGDLWVGSLGGVSVYLNDKWIKSTPAVRAVPALAAPIV